MKSLNVYGKIRRWLLKDKENAIMFGIIGVFSIIFSILLLALNLGVSYKHVDANVEATMEKEGVVLYNNSTQENISSVNVLVKAYNDKGEVYKTSETIYLNIKPYEEKMIEFWNYNISMNFNPSYFLLEVNDVTVIRKTLNKFMYVISGLLMLLGILFIIIGKFAESYNKSREIEKEEENMNRLCVKWKIQLMKK